MFINTGKTPVIPSHQWPSVAVVVPVSQGEEMFLPSFLRALQRNFLSESPKDVLVMLSGEEEGKGACDCGHVGCGPTHKRVRDVEKLIGSSGFEHSTVVLDSQGSTIHKRMMLHAQSWQKAEYVYVLRPQMLVQVPVKQEVLGDLVAVMHPGYCDQNRGIFRSLSKAR